MKKKNENEYKIFSLISIRVEFSMEKGSISLLSSSIPLLEVNINELKFSFLRKPGANAQTIAVQLRVMFSVNYCVFFFSSRCLSCFCLCIHIFQVLLFTFYFSVPFLFLFLFLFGTRFLCWRFDTLKLNGSPINVFIEI